MINITLYICPTATDKLNNLNSYIILFKLLKKYPSLHWTGWSNYNKYKVKELNSSPFKNLLNHILKFIVSRIKYIFTNQSSDQYDHYIIYHPNKEPNE